MSAQDIRVQAETLRTFNSATFTGSYQTFGSVFSHSIRIMKIQNTSNVSATISLDGINDHDIVPANSFVLYDFSSNKETGGAFSFPASSQIYIKGSAGVGTIYLSAYYAG